MEKTIDFNGVYTPSENVVAREIEGELILVPLINGIGDLEDELFSFNETGKAIWGELNGKNSVVQIIQILEKEFEGTPKQIKNDVLGFLNELLKHKMLDKIKKLDY
jgi:hypothetical protein